MRHPAINYTCGSTFIYSIVHSDALRIWNEGGRVVRVHISNWQDSAQILRDLQTCAVFAALGFYVIWGITSNNYLPQYTITTSNIQDFEDAVIEYAAVAPLYGVSEYVAGNEEELHNDGTTVSDNDMVVRILTWAAPCKAAFGGTVSTNFSQGAESIWTDKGLFDRIGINLYLDGDAETFLSRLRTAVSRWGSLVYLSEYGPWANWANSSNDERIDEMLTRKMRRYIRKNGVRQEDAIFFTYVNRTDSDSFAALEANGTYRLLYNGATSDRRWIDPNTEVSGYENIVVPF